MKERDDEEESAQGSLIVSFRSIYWAETLSFFFVSLGYPLYFWILHAAKVHKNGKTRLLLNGLGIAFTFLFGIYGTGPLVTWFHIDTAHEWYKTVALVLALTAACNVVFYVVVLVFDLHNLFRTSFQRAGKESVSEWLSHILGHKLWAGENTYRLLEHIQEESQVLGRAKWLLVGFLSTDIERRIQRDPDNKGDGTGDIANDLKATHPIYRITVHDWSVSTYSKFLADNMTHARKSINWVVDPVDLLSEIVPAHMIEVVVSIGSIIDNDVVHAIGGAKKALARDGLSVNWGTLLGRYAEWCPRQLVNGGSSGSICKKQHEKCPESFPFQTESSHRQYDYLWYAVFAGTLAALKSASVDEDGLKVAGGKRIRWKDVLSSYRHREGIVGSLVLPHIDEFRRAPCDKKRHIYLGIMPSNPGCAAERVRKGTANLKAYIDPKGDYVRCIAPRPDAAVSGSDHGLYSSLLAYTVASSGAIICTRPAGVEDLWAQVGDDAVCGRLLAWAVKLLEHTSGGRGMVKGVFVPDLVKDLVYENCHDIGFYDQRLVLSSGRGRERDVTWRVYQGQPTLERIYFPEGRSELVVAYEELASIISAALQ